MSDDHNEGSVTPLTIMKTPRYIVFELVTVLREGVKKGKTISPYLFYAQCHYVYQDGYRYVKDPNTKSFRAAIKCWEADTIHTDYVNAYETNKRAHFWIVPESSTTWHDFRSEEHTKTYYGLLTEPLLRITRSMQDVRLWDAAQKELAYSQHTQNRIPPGLELTPSTSPDPEPVNTIQPEEPPASTMETPTPVADETLVAVPESSPKQETSMMVPKAAVRDDDTNTIEPVQVSHPGEDLTSEETRLIREFFGAVPNPLPGWKYRSTWKSRRSGQNLMVRVLDELAINTYIEKVFWETGLKRFSARIPLRAYEARNFYPEGRVAIAAILRRLFRVGEQPSFETVRKLISAAQSMKMIRESIHQSGTYSREIHIDQMLVEMSKIYQRDIVSS